jgi:hypothetical protein
MTTLSPIQEHPMSKRHHLGRLAATAAGAVVLATTIGTGTAHAKDGDVRVAGRCTNGAVWKLKLGPRGGTIETEFEVDSNRVGQTWAVKLTDNGIAFVNGRATTAAPSGSFEIERRIANRPGRDTIVAVAAYRGHTCRGTASI